MNPELKAYTMKMIDRISRENDPEIDMLTGVLIGELRQFLNLDAIKAGPEEISKIIVRHSNAILGIGIKMGIKSVVEFVETASHAQSSPEKVAENPVSKVQ